MTRTKKIRTPNASFRFQTGYKYSTSTNSYEYSYHSLLRTVTITVTYWYDLLVLVVRTTCVALLATPLSTVFTVIRGKEHNSITAESNRTVRVLVLIRLSGQSLTVTNKQLRTRTETRVALTLDQPASFFNCWRFFGRLRVRTVTRTRTIRHGALNILSMRLWWWQRVGLASSCGGSTKTTNYS